MRSGQQARPDIAADAAVVLVVEDDRRMAAFLDRALTYAGYRTAMAEDGERALAAVAERAPDLVLLDVMLPGIDGLAVARRLLADAGAADPAEAGILDDVSAEAERMSRLVAGLLLLAQADAGQHLTLRPTDLAAVARDAARSARLLRDDVRVAADGVADPLWVAGHADRLRQVLMILLDNAVRHAAPAGRVTLTAGPSPGRPGSARPDIVVVVADDGPGIAAEAQARIFERFYRAPGSRSGEGTGLGLAIARWIVEEHGGTIAVESAPGRGATFTIRLPTPATPPADSPATDDGTPQSVGRPAADDRALAGPTPPARSGDPVQAGPR